MNGTLRAAYEKVIAAAEAAAAARGTERAFDHLARAHILSQRHTFQHVYVHWRMLRLGASACRWQEVFGQASRIVAAAIFSHIWVPVGNTGRANVSALKPMPVPWDLKAILEDGNA
ncbi:MAG: DUF3703 domain-containing protein [Betaproteobacteria bacterium]|nr:DUF3703 domain-containing protein [Betaproteobacteria bacterium]